MIRSCSTAAAQNAGTLFCNFSHSSGKIFRTNIKNCLTVFFTRKTCVRFYNYRNTGCTHKTLNRLKHFLRAKGTVQSKGIHSQTFKNCRHGFRICSGKQVTFQVINIGDKKWHLKSGFVHCLFCCKNRRLCFIGIVHGFNDNAVYITF